MDVIKTQEVLSRAIEKVIVHPLVLLSVVDHYNRVAKDTRKRVVGVLLGSSFKGTVDVTNSYAVPFEEDEKDPSIWFLDHNFHESMFSMFKRINAKEHVVGWYSTGPKLRENDLDIHGLFNDYLPNPVLVIIDVQPKDLGIPAQAYCAVEENATQKSQKVFVHVLSEIAAHEVEEIGVEHLLRDVKDPPISSLTTEIDGKLKALKSLDRQLREIRSYLDLAIDGKLPLNHEILYHLQDVFNLLPNLNVTELIKSFSVKTNDMILVIYLASLIRSVIALHNLINNKVARKNSIMADEARNPPANNPSVRYIPRGGSWSPFDNLEAADRVVHFRQGNPPYYDGKPPKEKLENWLHEMQTRFQASEYVANSWVPLAVIQLRGMAARWWRSIGRDQWLLGWSEFSDLILTRFSPNDEPESPEPMDKETAQYIRFSTIMQCWGHKAKAGESMEDYVQQFEREFLNGSPYDLSDDEKCRMFWLGVPMHIREHVSYHCNDYYRLRTEVLSAERLWMAQRAREQKQVYFRRLEPSSTVVGHSLRSSRTTASDATTSSRTDHDEEDPEEIQKEDPEENKD